MKNVFASALAVWRDAQPALAGFAALGDQIVAPHKFPDARFNAIIVGCAVLVVVAGLTARGFRRHFAHRPRHGATRRLAPALAPEPRVEPAARIEPTFAPEAPRPDASAWSPELLNALEWRRFESVCAACFESLGFRVRSAPLGAERRVDLRLHRRDSERPSILVRCKAARRAPVDAEEARELLAALKAEGAAQGIVVTSGSYTREARQLADGKALHLIDGRDLLWKLGHLSEARQRALLEQVTEGDFATPSCPVCGAAACDRAQHAESETPPLAARVDPQVADYCSRVMLP
ncbi:MAG TPA: restriction endonuclease [Burkholderiales bacterium]|nr:restriction endonuclease [Burkholderiales bacterium]